MSCRTCCCRKLSLLVLLLAAGLLVAPAFAQNCLQDEFTLAGNTQKLNCTANDVRVAKVINVRDLSGNQLTSCISGTTFNFIADFLVQTTANSTRSNIGLYFDTGNINTQPTALTGQCSDNIIPPAHTCTNTGGTVNSTVTCGSTHYDELDPSPDNCGDSSSTDPPVCLNSSNQVVSCSSGTVTQTFPSTQIVTVEIDNFTCSAPAGTNQVQLPNCTSWQIPGKTIQCIAAAPAYLYPSDTNGHPEAIPGSPSKCNCATIPLGITVQSPQVAVAKSCVTTNTPAPTPPATNTSCTLSPEGGQVVYTVAITNQSNFGNIIVDQICDSAYGNIFTVAGFSGPACAAGTVGSITSSNTTCSALDIAAGNTSTCTFTVTQNENLKVQDIVNVSGHGASAGSFGPTASNQVTVTSGEAPTTGTITKGFASNTNICATVRYNVDVADTSAAGTDETLTLSALSDNTFGDITKWTSTGNTLVLGTTCGVAVGTAGLGSLSGVTASATNGGALPATVAVGGDYKCQFDAQFCSAPTTIVTTAGVCAIGSGTCTSGKVGSACTQPSDCSVTCNGIQHSNQVSATVTGDEGATDVVTLTPGGLTVNECVTVQ